VALLYLVMSLPLVAGLRRLESHLRKEARHDRDPRFAKALRRARGAQGRQPGRGGRRGGVPDRALGLGQVHRAALHQRAGSYQGGDIRADGERVDARSKCIQRLRSRMGMVFQRFNLFPTAPCWTT
jgi:hypothetical protein